ncbi:hypothetical protein IV203_015099 [Nitzschia inconspicua]|uniref:Uncharacterized protein n=1 Tax=Nitzschia inconspicua TaxID=303405 RepID=A0A9K3PSS4_9STRA|nr:hypothetical protein IV203_015099 [Nitzschia inconspicua]
MQSLEIDIDSEEEETVPLTNDKERQSRHEVTSLRSHTYSSKNPTLSQQCLALILILLGTFVSTSIVFHLGRIYRSPWYFRPATAGMPLSDLLKLQRNSSNAANNTFTTHGRNNTIHPKN